MPRQCTNEQHQSQHPVESFWRQTTIGNTPNRHNHRDDDSLVTHMALTPSITTTQQIGIGIRYLTTCLDSISSIFFLPRDQIDDILNLEVDVN